MLDWHSLKPSILIRRFMLYKFCLFYMFLYGLGQAINATVPDLFGIVLLELKIGMYIWFTACY
jgi:hypothetical protein